MIQINLLRISTDSKYLEFSIECPIDYVFNTLFIRRYDDIEHPEGYNASSLLQGTSTKEIIKINTSNFGGSSLFYVTFGVKWNGITPETNTIDNVTGVCSDINKVYANMLDAILTLNTGCIESAEYENLVRNQMFLYAHTEAMRLERYNEAEMFYDIIKNLFTNCGPTTRQNGMVTKSCNCL